MTAMDELVAWLREQLDEDERVARAATAGPWDWGIPSPAYWRRTEEGPASEDLLSNESGQWVLMTSKAGAVSAPDAAHIARWDPSRVLAEVEAKRRIIDRCLEGIAEDEWVRNLSPLAEGVILHLAQPYADRPGFKDEWRLT